MPTQKVSTDADPNTTWAELNEWLADVLSDGAALVRGGTTAKLRAHAEERLALDFAITFTVASTPFARRVKARAAFLGYGEEESVRP